MNYGFKLLTMIILIVVATTGWTQNKGGRWQFEGNGDDTADWDTQDNAGELQGAATYSNQGPAEGDSYLWLTPDSVNNYFRIDDGDDLDFADEDIGISMWIYPVILNSVHFLINKGDQYPVQKTTNYSLRISNEVHLEFLVRVNNVAQKVASSFTIPVNQWTFIAVFYDYNAGKVYFWNTPTSTPTDTVDFSQPLVPNSDPLSIGAWYRSDPADPADRDFKGRIDDVRLSGSLENILPVTSEIEHQIGQNRLSEFNLNQNYPNPFNAETTISFRLPATVHVLLDVYDITGRNVAIIADQKLAQGVHTYRFNAENLPTGVYFYRITTKNQQQIKKMILMK
jgi:hypothetical protein